jgi:hypothetical protein
VTDREFQKSVSRNANIVAGRTPDEDSFPAGNGPTERASAWLYVLTILTIIAGLVILWAIHGCPQASAETVTPAPTVTAGGADEVGPNVSPSPGQPDAEGQGLRTSSPGPLSSNPVSAALRADGETAAQLVPLIGRLCEHDLPPDLTYRIAHAIARWSRNYGLDPKIVVGLISVESDFTPSCHSSTNDYGLMQLNGRPDLYDIEDNIIAGCAHLKGNLDAAGGRYDLALCAYNTGRQHSSVGERYAAKVLGRAGR